MLIIDRIALRPLCRDKRAGYVSIKSFYGSRTWKGRNNSIRRCSVSRSSMISLLSTWQLSLLIGCRSGFHPGNQSWSRKAQGDQPVGIEFEVDYVDALYEKLKNLVVK